MKLALIDVRHKFTDEFNTFLSSMLVLSLQGLIHSFNSETQRDFVQMLNAMHTFNNSLRRQLDEEIKDFGI